MGTVQAADVKAAQDSINHKLAQTAGGKQEPQDDFEMTGSSISKPVETKSWLATAYTKSAGYICYLAEKVANFVTAAWKRIVEFLSFSPKAKADGAVAKDKSGKAAQPAIIHNYNAPVVINNGVAAGDAGAAQVAGVDAGVLELAKQITEETKKDGEAGGFWSMLLGRQKQPAGESSSSSLEASVFGSEVQLPPQGYISSACNYLRAAIVRQDETTIIQDLAWWTSKDMVAKVSGNILTSQIKKSVFSDFKVFDKNMTLHDFINKEGFRSEKHMPGYKAVILERKKDGTYVYSLEKKIEFVMEAKTA